MRIIQAVTAAAIALAIGAQCSAQDTVDGFVGRSFTTAQGLTMPYRLFIPDAEARKTRLPLIVYLHGSGGVGTDNLKQITIGNTNGTHVWTTPEAQKKHPAFVLAPQMTEDTQWGTPESAALSRFEAAVLDIVAAVSQEFNADASRVYLTGQSRGGFGSWDLLSKRPGVFAAAVPLCGGGDPARVVAARGLPIWVFHGAKDETVPVEASRELVKALKAAGSAVKYTEYPDAGHDVWNHAYLEPGLADWLFSQHRRVNQKPRKLGG